MLKKFLLVVLMSMASIGFAFAQVDANKADQAGLDGIKGIGPKMSQRILDERNKGGPFKDWNDLQSRVKGIKEKSAIRLSGAGLTVNGQPKNAASTAAVAPAILSASVTPAASAKPPGSSSQVVSNAPVARPVKPSPKITASGTVQAAPTDKNNDVKK